MMVAQLCEDSQIQGIVCFKRVDFIACELYLNNAVIKNMQERDCGECGKMETADLLEMARWKVLLFLFPLLLFVEQ